MADGAVAISAGSGTPIRVLTGLGASAADQQVMTLADSAGNLLGTTGAPVPTTMVGAIPTGANYIGVTRTGDGTYSASIKYPNTAAHPGDPSSAVAIVSANAVVVTATAAAATVVTATLPAPGAGLFHYITKVHVQRFMSAAGTAAGTAVVTGGTNQPLVFNLPTDAAAQGTLATVVDFVPPNPIRSTTVNTATTFTTPAVTANIYRITVIYYVAAS